MTALTFDTLDAARSLGNAGVDEKTAEAIVAVVQRTTVLPDISDLATRDQVEAVRLASRDQLENVEKRLVSAISDMRNIMFGLFLMNITAILGIGAFLYTLVKR